MPWRETCRMDEKLEFVLACLRGECRWWRFARTTESAGRRATSGWGRYRAHGPAGLVERSRAPRCHGRSMVPEVAEAIVALRRERPHWGPRKLRAVLMRAHPGTVWPAASTMGDLLRAEGLVPRRRLRRRLPSPDRPFRLAAGPNDVWCIDFKGWVPDRRRGAVRSADDHRRVEPLPSCGGDRAAAHGPGHGGGRGGVPALRRAAGAALGQRRALCQHGCGRPVAVVGALGEGGHRAGADRSGPAAAERPPRADAPDAQDGDGEAAGGQRCGATSALRPLPGRVQRRAAARGVGPGAAGNALPARAAAWREPEEPVYDASHAVRRSVPTAASSGAARRSS